MTALHKFHEPLGALVVSFSQLETATMFAIVSLIGAEQNVGLALVSEMSFAKRLDALQSIAPFTIKEAPLCEELAEIIAHMSQSEGYRNTILHTTWMLSGPDEVLRLKPTAKRKKGLQTNLRNATLDDVVQANEHIKASLLKFSAFLRKIQDKGILKIPFCH